MELIYTKQRTGFEPGKFYRSPQHFDRPELDVTRVTVIGDWPNIVAAYEEAGVEVEVVEAPKLVVIGGNGIDSQVLSALRQDLEAVGIIVESLSNGELQKPDEGETALALFDALTKVSESFESLVAERDGLIVKSRELTSANEQLQLEVKGLRDAAAKNNEADEIQGLKIKLDSAGVSYRANASKETLQKLVADLDKQDS